MAGGREICKPIPTRAAGLRIRITLMRIRTQRFNLKRIRILLLIKVNGWCESASTAIQTLQGSICSLHASIVRVHSPSTAPFWASDASEFRLQWDPDPFFTLMRIRIQRPKIMRIRTRNPVKSVDFFNFVVFLPVQDGTFLLFFFLLCPSFPFEVPVRVSLLV